MSDYGGVNVVCQMVFAHKLWVVESRVVGGEEEDAGNQELVVGAFALLRRQYTRNRLRNYDMRTLSFSAACGPCPRSTSIWRVFGCRSRALAMHRSASWEVEVSLPSKA